MKLLVATLAVLLIAPSLAKAAGPSFSYEGRAFDATGNPLNASVTFKITVRPPGATYANCVLYSETQTQNLASSNGFFTIAINGSGSSPQFGGGLTSINQVFANSGSVTLTSTDCGGTVSPYTPTASDGRNLVVSLSTDSGSTFEDLPPVAIGSVPYAIEAQQIVGYKTSQLLRTDPGVTGTTQFTQTMLDDLHSLLAGTSPKYAAKAANGTANFTVTSDPSSPSEGAVWFNTTNHKLMMRQNSTNVEVAAGGGVSGITALTTDVSATGTGSVAATVNSVGGSWATNIHSAELLANAATSLNTTGAIVKRDAASNFAANIATLNGLALNNSGSVVNIVNPPTSGYTLTLPATAGSSGQVLSTNGIGYLSWVNAIGAAESNTFTGNNAFSGTNSFNGLVVVGNATVSTSTSTGALTVAGGLGVNGRGSFNNLSVGTGTAGLPSVGIGSTSSGLFGASGAGVGVTVGGGSVATFNASSISSTVPINVQSASGFTYTSSGAVSSFSNTHGLTLFKNANYDLNPNFTIFKSTNNSSNTQYGYMGTVTTPGSSSSPAMVFGRSTNPSNYDESMRISDFGNVGIGTTAPQAKLDVAGQTRLGMNGTIVSNTGICTVAAAIPATTGTSLSCTGGSIPATTGIAVSCSPSSVPTSGGTWSALATGNLNEVRIYSTAGWSGSAPTWNCMWMQP